MGLGWWTYRARWFRSVLLRRWCSSCIYMCVCLVWGIEVQKVRSEAVGWYLSCIHCRVEVSSEVYAVRSWLEASILRGGCVIAGIMV